MPPAAPRTVTLNPLLEGMPEEITLFVSRVVCCSVSMLLLVRVEFFCIFTHVTSKE